MGINYVLKPGGVALVVIGNSILQGILIPTDQYFGKIAQAVGLELVRIDVPRITRVGNSIIQSNVRVEKAQDSYQLYEAIVELRKGNFINHLAWIASRQYLTLSRKSSNTESSSASKGWIGSRKR